MSRRDDNTLGTLGVILLVMVLAATVRQLFS